MTSDIYQQVFETVPLPILVITSEGVVLDVNQEYINQLCGGSPDRHEIIGKNYQDLPFIVRLGVSGIYKKMQAGKESQTADVAIPLAGNKSPSNFRIVSQPVFEKNKPVAVVLLHQDMSEVVQLKKERETQEVMLDEIQAVSGLGSWDLHVPSGKAVWSKEEYRLLDYDPDKDEATPDNFTARIHEEDRGGVLLALNKPFEDKSIYKAEFRLVMPDGNIRYVAERGRVIFDEQGNAERFIGTTHDITERVEAEAKLKSSEEELSKILENLQDTYYRTDVEGRVVRVSPSVETLLGYKPEEVLGMKIIDLYVHPEERQRLYKELQETGGQVQAFEAPLKRKDGSVIWVSTNAQYFIKNGEVLGIEGTTRNITQLKMAQEELCRHQKELESMVEERTRELEAFSYSVSHDLRAPLRSINGFSQAIEEEYSKYLDEAGKDYLRRVRASTQRMSDLIDDLLQLARINRQNINFKDVEISAVVKNIIDELTSEDPARHAKINIAPGIVVKGDERLLEVGLRNLVKNAWKFTGKKHETVIEFGVMNYVKKTPPVYFLRDNGVGFDMKYMDKLFLPFHRLHNVDEFKGTGIGLAIVKRVVERHYGDIWAESAENQGATFYFTLSTDASDCLI
jgi:PAS domain S-box-containing protein